MKWNIWNSFRSFTKFIDIRLFIASFIVGSIMVYFVVPLKRQVFVYPTPDNIDQLHYRDKANQCFQWTQHEVNCPQDPHEIYKMPGQV